MEDYPENRIMYVGIMKFLQCLTLEELFHKLLCMQLLITEEIEVRGPNL